jgi:hypothetical protein
MKTLTLIFFISLFAHGAFATAQLRVGDILLQPLDCRTCSLIEAEEDTIYSHMGMVISVGPLLIAEALGRVRALPFEVFNERTQKGQKLRHLRLKDPEQLRVLSRGVVNFQQLFAERFEGRRYDHEFLWDNIDSDGNEALYCSEFVAKMLTAFLGDIGTPIKRMHFSKNPEEWYRHFGGKIPVGQWGNSPGDFERSPIFEHLGEM